MRRGIKVIKCLIINVLREVVWLEGGHHENNSFFFADPVAGCKLVNCKRYKISKNSSKFETSRRYKKMFEKGHHTVEIIFCSNGRDFKINLFFYTNRSISVFPIKNGINLFMSKNYSFGRYFNFDLSRESKERRKTRIRCNVWKTKIIRDGSIDVLKNVWCLL